MKENLDVIDPKLPLNIALEDEHAPHIKKFNRTLKDRRRMCFTTLPFKNYKTYGG